MESYYSFLQAGSQLENTLQQVTVPMSVQEVGGYIEKQVAYLSGGRGEDSSVIITLPECSAFSDIPEEALAKVLTYLTLIPRQRQPGVKFIIILDRRLDTWSSVKTALARIAASFPGSLHLVLVLRPTNFFQRTVTDIGFRFSQEDFVLKMPVVMLSSVTDLLRYVDETQLTPEFGGTLDYSHSDWLVLQTAIESFAVTVKEIAQMLQAFGTELAEAELPEEGGAIRFLLMSHIDKYRKLKNDIQIVMREGHHLLSRLEASGILQDSSKHWAVSQDWETVQRLLAQLRDMETAFDGFFDKHHLKMRQYLQLLKYEQNFQELGTSLDKLCGQESKMATSGDSLVQVEQLIKDLDVLDAQAQEEMSQAQVLILKGHQLAASHHYALALILQRCNELRHRCDMLSAALLARRTQLSRTRELLLQLDEVFQWCDEATYLLASQVVDKFQTKEGAQKSLQELEKVQKAAPPLMSTSPDVLAVEFEPILTPQLQAHIRKAHEKLQDVQGMIQKRQISLKRMADKQVRPIQLVAPRPENTTCSKSPLFSPKHDLKFTFDISLPGKKASRKNSSSRKIEVMHDYQENRNSFSYGLEGEDSPDLLKRRVMKELIETERVYVDELLSVLLGYWAEMDKPELAGPMPPMLRNKRDVLFGNMPEIYSFHSRLFLHDLEGCLENPEGVGACFLERKEHFQVYERYCQNKPRSESLWRQCSDCAFFQECQRKLDHKLALDSYLLKPVQRLTKYQLLLKELLKYSTGCNDVPELQGALVAMLDLLKSVNDSMHQTAITGYMGELSELGKVLMQGSFSLWVSHKKGATRVKELARFKPMQRHLFLYERALLFCKRREEHSGEAGEKTPSYSFKHCLKMSAVGITEKVKGDEKKFEIWYSGREEVYVVQAPSVEVKLAWLNEIRRVLTSQQKLTGDPLNSSSVSEQIQLSPPISDSKLQRTSVSSEDNETSSTSPVLLDPVDSPPSQQGNRRSWPGDSLSDSEGWSGARDSTHLSDTETIDLTPLVPGRYRVLVDYERCHNDSFVVKSGDVIQLLQEDCRGCWMVRNLSRRLESRMPDSHLQVILGLASRGHSSRLRDKRFQKTRKLSTP